MGKYNVSQTWLVGYTTLVTQHSWLHNTNQKKKRVQETNSHPMLWGVCNKIWSLKTLPQDTSNMSSKTFCLSPLVTLMRAGDQPQTTVWLTIQL